MQVLVRLLVPRDVPVCSTTQTGMGCDIGRADAVIGALLAMAPPNHQRAERFSYQMSERVNGSQLSPWAR